MLDFTYKISATNYASSGSIKISIWYFVQNYSSIHAFNSYEKLKILWLFVGFHS
jgi:hypothetical protein